MNKHTTGFTLIELIVYIAIASILILTAAGFIQSILQIQRTQKIASLLEANGNNAMRRITQAVRNADSITLPTTGTSGTTLTVATYSGPTNPTSYTLSGGQLREQLGAGSVTPITSTEVTVSALSFYNLSRAATPGAVRIQYTVTYGTQSKTFYGTATLR
ncbi:MAG: prepilin-type N-terminal cleavage/methylation domain-containing protein [Patescibacteria group bacterium]